MANYNYDEAGNMATYFVITFLALILTPMTFSMSSLSKRQTIDGCQCQPCIDQRARVAKSERGSLWNSKINRRVIFLALGWALFGYLCYKVAKVEDVQVYNPFEILGISTRATAKEIKSHFKKLSLRYHPDKVKATANETIEDIANRFVQITKAYKSLTDPQIRQNWELYGHPDGRQEVSMGLAIPKWIVEDKNNVYVLGFYGVLFGGALPLIVGRWWFGSRQKTKDGINARSAAAFFKTLKEESTMEDVVGTLGKAYQWDAPASKASSPQEVDQLEKRVEEVMGNRWADIRRLAESHSGPHESRRRALVLLHAHLLRLPIVSPLLQAEQRKIILQTPLLLNALLNVSTARSWLLPTLAVMRLHSYLAQALLPGGNDRIKLAQLPGFEPKEVVPGGRSDQIQDFVQALEKSGDARLSEVKRALKTWSRVEVVDASFRVIDERVVTPSSIVYLIIKLRISPPDDASLVKEEPKEETDVEVIKQSLKGNEAKDLEFLNSKTEAEELHGTASGWAHAPYWPGTRKPSWWLVLADDKSNRVVVPPIKIADIPMSNPELTRNYRSYKLQFQAPNSTGLFTWKLYLINDTLVGEEVTRDIALQIDDATEDDVADDEISEPEEDSLAGQMALMKGGSVKKAKVEESDEESGTDDGSSDSESSDSDSD